MASQEDILKNHINALETYVKELSIQQQPPQIHITENPIPVIEVKPIPSTTYNVIAEQPPQVNVKSSLPNVGTIVIPQPISTETINSWKNEESLTVALQLKLALAIDELERSAQVIDNKNTEIFHLEEQIKTIEKATENEQRSREIAIQNIELWKQNDELKKAALEALEVLNGKTIEKVCVDEIMQQRKQMEGLMEKLIQRFKEVTVEKSQLEIKLRNMENLIQMKDTKIEQIQQTKLIYEKFKPITPTPLSNQIEIEQLKKENKQLKISIEELNKNKRELINNVEELQKQPVVEKFIKVVEKTGGEEYAEKYKELRNQLNDERKEWKEEKEELKQKEEQLINLNQSLQKQIIQQSEWSEKEECQQIIKEKNSIIGKIQLECLEAKQQVEKANEMIQHVQQIQEEKESYLKQKQALDIIKNQLEQDKKNLEEIVIKLNNEIQEKNKQIMELEINKKELEQTVTQHVNELNISNQNSKNIINQKEKELIDKNTEIKRLNERIEQLQLNLHQKDLSIQQLKSIKFEQSQKLSQKLQEHSSQQHSPIEPTISPPPQQNQIPNQPTQPVTSLQLVIGTVNPSTNELKPLTNEPKPLTSELNPTLSTQKTQEISNTNSIKQNTSKDVSDFLERIRPVKRELENDSTPVPQKKQPKRIETQEEREERRRKKFERPLESPKRSNSTFSTSSTPLPPRHLGNEHIVNVATTNTIEHKEQTQNQSNETKNNLEKNTPSITDKEEQQDQTKVSPLSTEANNTLTNQPQAITLQPSTQNLSKQEVNSLEVTPQEIKPNQTEKPILPTTNKNQIQQQTTVDSTFNNSQPNSTNPIITNNALDIPNETSVNSPLNIIQPNSTTPQKMVEEPIEQKMDEVSKEDSSQKINGQDFSSFFTNNQQPFGFGTTNNLSFNVFNSDLQLQTQVNMEEGINDESIQKTNKMEEEKKPTMTSLEYSSQFVNTKKSKKKEETEMGVIMQEEENEEESSSSSSEDSQEETKEVEEIENKKGNFYSIKLQEKDAKKEKRNAGMKVVHSKDHKKIGKKNKKGERKSGKHAKKFGKK
ncbi:hypothetical protein, conserved [Entamoeba dispar SAW760]|uniref:Uncharacterized protein n=1 Tax=Entamoeba dispar (strain ATCC PRA-260 / SAW760) TaxID=370354 RepID=B0EDA7_ENTDS|nr:uncharacterized protein EDI_093150 [Entamoeba dispar SAW760]EDR27524.1 hypothetical protein, conserved [Entamoeba dispar SAW760]|eukprot:EDR27524.1 hypothetical protein, conserved [Entamoeba dispar SAW760]